MDVIPWIGENLPEHLRECDKDAVMFYGQFRRMSWGVDYMAWQAIDEEGKCMGIGGVLKEWKGMATAFMALSDEVIATPFWFHRRVRQYIDVVIKEMELHRLQAYVEAGHPERENWIERLGFVREGVLHQFCYNRKDWVIFAWLSSSPL